MSTVDYADWLLSLQPEWVQNRSARLKEAFTCEEIEELRLRIAKYGPISLGSFRLQSIGIRKDDCLGVLYAAGFKTCGLCRLFLHSFLVYSISPDGKWVARHDLDVDYSRDPGKESFNMTAWARWRERPWWKRWFRKQPASLNLEEQMERWNVCEAPEIDPDSPEYQDELEAAWNVDSDKE